jgi:hypothetical protein
LVTDFRSRPTASFTNTATGDLHFDPDGSGLAPSQIIANLQNEPTVIATDIFII